jgi:hypothetical protein
VLQASTLALVEPDLDGATKDGEKTEEVPVHFGFVCSGCVHGGAIRGNMFTCDDCDDSFCNDCYSFHDKKHELRLTRTANNYEEEGWVITNILGHRNTVEGGEYQITYQGFAQPYWQPSGNVLAGQMLDAYMADNDLAPGWDQIKKAAKKAVKKSSSGNKRKRK